MKARNTENTKNCLNSKKEEKDRVKIPITFKKLSKMEGIYT